MNQEQNREQYQKDLITADEVKSVVNGDVDALIAQLARAKQVALEQLEAKKKGIVTTQTVQKTEAELEAEVLKREAELNAALASAKLGQRVAGQNTVNLNISDVALDKRVEQVERDIQSRTTPIDTTRILSAANVSVTNVPNTPVAQPITQQIDNKQLKLQQEQAKKAEKERILQEKRLAKQKALEMKRLAKEQRKANSNFKYFMTAFLFIALIVLVNFLPEITNYVEAYKASKAQREEVITSGILKCSFNKYDDNFDYQYVSDFYFSDNKLEKFVYRVTTKGDKNKDINTLEELNTKCNNLKHSTNDLSGVLVKCSLSEGVNISEQTLVYKDIDIDSVNASYVEAGGVYPNYKYQDDIDKIQKNMYSTGYTCERSR